MARAPEDVDALRAKLKGLGYLDAGVDRFVLAPARSGRGLAHIALRSSVRIGVLAGLLLGISGTLAATVRLPGLVTGARDALVLAAMLGLAFGTAAFLLTFVVVWATARALRWPRARARVATRGRRLSAAAGALVGAASLAYLTLWWGAATGGAAAVTTAATAAAVMVAAIISVLLGHSATTIIKAVLAADAPDTAAPRRPLSLRWSAAMALLGALASAALLALGTPAPARDETPPPLTVVPTGLKVVVFAFDGYDRALAERWFGGDQQGEGWLAQRGWEMPRESHDPAREWTTVATGQPAGRHGVTALEVRRLAGIEGRLPGDAAGSRWTGPLAAATDLVRLTKPTLNTGVVRREKTFWEVAAQAGLRTVAVNWWTSWPAAEEDGVVLTERAVLRLQAGGDLAGEIAPASLYLQLRARWPDLAREADALARDVLAAPRAGGGGVPAEGPTADPTLPGTVAEALLEAATVDAQQIVLLEATTAGEVDLATVYLPGLDILATKLGQIDRDRVTASLLVDRADALLRYYRWLGRAVGRERARLASRGFDPWWIGHPGRAAGDDRVLLVANGRAGMDEGGNAGSAALLDVTPTVLRLLGVPLSRELSGRPLWDPAQAGPDGGRPAGAPGAATPTVSTYGRRGTGPVRTRGQDSLDEEMRERLRSLGYVR